MSAAFIDKNKWLDTRAAFIDKNKWLDTRSGSGKVRQKGANMDAMMMQKYARFKNFTVSSTMFIGEEGHASLFIPSRNTKDHR
jgi:hypothetical protein